jgi:hypothetical protein
MSATSSTLTPAESHSVILKCLKPCGVVLTAASSMALLTRQRHCVYVPGNAGTPRASSCFVVFEGKKLTCPQTKWSLGTRSWSEAQSKAKDLQERLKDFVEGKVVPKGMTVEAALREWYEFRDQDGLDNTKAKLMGGKLVAWCEENNILLLTALTTDKVIKWRVTLPFRSGDSSSLSVHWSVISSFFSWVAGMGYIDKSPIPRAEICSPAG